MPTETDPAVPSRPTDLRGILGGAFWSLREAARSDPRWLMLTVLTSLMLALVPAAQVRVVAWLVEAASGTSWRAAPVPLTAS